MLAQTALGEFTVDRTSTELEERIQQAINSRRFGTAVQLAFDSGNQTRADELFELGFGFLRQGYLTCEDVNRLENIDMLPWEEVYTAIKYTAIKYATLGATLGLSVIALKKIENEEKPSPSVTSNYFIDNNMKWPLPLGINVTLKYQNVPLARVLYSLQEQRIIKDATIESQIAPLQFEECAILASKVELQERSRAMYEMAIDFSVRGRSLRRLDENKKELPSVYDITNAIKIATRAGLTERVPQLEALRVDAIERCDRAERIRIAKDTARTKEREDAEKVYNATLIAITQKYASMNGEFPPL